MTDLKLIYDYRDIPEYRHSFNELANSTFGINFETWHGKGGWNDRYICYSYVKGSKIVANVSINKMDLILKGKSKRAIQIGTVMTHPDYRNRGLAADLMNSVLEEYEKSYDFIYLFANESVLNFYPKFGFTGIGESQISMDINIKQSEPHNLKKLDISNDFNIIYRLTCRRCPVSKVSGVKNDQHLLLFYCLYVFHDSLYYSEDEDFIVIFRYEGDKLLLYDIIGENEISQGKLLNKISSEKIKKVIFHFTPDLSHIDTCSVNVLPADNGLFIKPLLTDMTGEFMFPLTSRA